MANGKYTENQSPRTEYCTRGCTPGRFEGQEQQWDCKYTQHGWEHAHSNIWDTRFEIILANIFEIEISVKSTKPTGKRNEEFGKRGVNIHKEPSLDVFGRKTTEAVSTGISKSAIIYKPL